VEEPSLRPSYSLPELLDAASLAGPWGQELPRDGFEIRARTLHWGQGQCLTDIVPSSRRVRLQTDERRNQLLELGSKVFSTRSYEDVSIDELAQMANISKGLLYHYFRSKREFYVETIRSDSLRLRQLTEPDPTLPPAAQLRTAIDAHLEFIRVHGKIYVSIQRSGATIAPEVQDILEEHRDVVMQWFLRSLQITKPKPVLLAALRGWLTLVEGMSLDWIASPTLRQDALRELLVSAYAALVERAQQLDAKGNQVSGPPRPVRKRRA
jgi:AcrR family transcriptional regulator